jgi:hypothetical protein
VAHAERGVREPDDLARVVDGIAEALDPAEGAEVLEGAAAGPRQERVGPAARGGERDPGDLAGVVDGIALAEAPAGEDAESVRV